MAAARLGSSRRSTAFPQQHARAWFVRGRTRCSRTGFGRSCSEYRGTAGYYVQSLTSGRGAAWNAKARFPAASTLKLAIATAVLSRHSGIPPPDSYVGGLLREMITVSDDAAANALEVWLAGSTSAGSAQVNTLMRSIGLVDSIMYGGYEVRSLSASIPVRVDDPPVIAGKYTTAWDMASLWRAIWLASGAKGPLREAQPGFTPADARHLLWLAANVRDTPKLDRVVGERRGVHVLHKAGWISTLAPRHRARVLARRGLRRRRDDVATVGNRPVLGRSRRAGRGPLVRAFPPLNGIETRAFAGAGSHSLHFSYYLHETYEGVS